MQEPEPPNQTNFHPKKFVQLNEEIFYTFPIPPPPHKNNFSCQFARSSNSAHSKFLIITWKNQFLVITGRKTICYTCAKS